MDYYDERDRCPELEGGVNINFENSEIRKFYAGASIFITGGAGFLGGLVVEKIARSCPDFGKIYLLLRPKKGLTPSQRLESMFQDEVFDKMKKENPAFISRVHVMEGDLGDPVCGLSQENQQIIREEVHLIFHIAACLRMVEPLNTAYTMNVRSTKDLLDLAITMKQLKGFVYVSTAYSNCFRADISETFYQPTYNWKELQDLVQVGTEEQLQCLASKILGASVNTYTFTKAIAEDTVKMYVGRIPVAVARPSIVIGCAAEPMKNWINNIYGPTGMAAGGILGISRLLFIDKNKVADLIPADYVVNNIIAIQWQIARQHEAKERVETPIYNVVSSSKAPITWGHYTELSAEAAIESRTTCKQTLGESFVIFVSNRWLYYLLFAIIHLGQGLVIDTCLWLKGKPPQLFKAYIKIMRFSVQMSFFGEHEWKFEQPNVDKLLSEMNEDDKKIFPFDMTDFDWRAYHLYTVRAIIRYIIKAYDDVLNPTAAKKRYMKMVKWRRRIFSAAALFITYFFIKFVGRAVLNFQEHS